MLVTLRVRTTCSACFKPTFSTKTLGAMHSRCTGVVCRCGVLVALEPATSAYAIGFARPRRLLAAAPRARPCRSPALPGAPLGQPSTTPAGPGSAGAPTALRSSARFIVPRVVSNTHAAHKGLTTGTLSRRSCAPAPQPRPAQWPPAPPSPRAAPPGRASAARRRRRRGAARAPARRAWRPTGARVAPTGARAAAPGRPGAAGARATAGPTLLAPGAGCRSGAQLFSHITAHE
jgi:hypothetical protein